MVTFPSMLLRYDPALLSSILLFYFTTYRAVESGCAIEVQNLVYGILFENHEK
jgi:hypothetical protein